MTGNTNGIVTMLPNYLKSRITGNENDNNVSKILKNRITGNNNGIVTM